MKSLKEDHNFYKSLNKLCDKIYQNSKQLPKFVQNIFDLNYAFDTLTQNYFNVTYNSKTYEAYNWILNQL
jgi:hypothetical protein